MPTKTFYGRFKQNMATMGLDAPETLFATAEKSIATITALATAVNTLGSSVTVAEVAVAGSGMETMIAIGAVSASFYLGACIGCFIMATESYVSDQISLPRFQIFTVRHGVKVSQSTLHSAYYRYVT